MYSIRQEQMRIYIEEKNVVTIKELQALFPEVSLMTIHRDLDALQQSGTVVKFRGGAKSVRHTGDPEFNVRMRENNTGKMLIAKKALELIQPHSSIFLDASTTNLALARQLPDININVFTTGPSSGCNHVLWHYQSEKPGCFRAKYLKNAGGDQY